jgi:hypothetical protein
MLEKNLPRRDFLKTILAGVPMLALDWDSFPRGKGKSRDDSNFDVVIIGAGLGGLSCAAAFARQGFKPLVELCGCLCPTGIQTPCIGTALCARRVRFGIQEAWRVCV